MANFNSKSGAIENGYFANVTVSQDRKYSRSYGNPEDVEYSLAILDGNWITLYSGNCRYSEKKKVNAKHFHYFTGEIITERTFKMRLKKAQNKAK